MTRVCEQCGGVFRRQKETAERWQRRRFCCRRCYDLWLDVRYPGRRRHGTTAARPAGNVAGWRQAVERGIAGQLADRIVHTRPVPPMLLAAIRTYQPPATLTAAQLRCVVAAADGLTNREIATVTGMAPDTVLSHLKGAYRRMGVRNRVEAARVVWEAREAA